MQLAGHGKDPRLVQVELPIVPNVGDRIREDCNSMEWAHKLDHLIREGEFIEIFEKYGTKYWSVKLKNGKFALFNPQDSEIVERVLVLVEKENNQSLLEQDGFAVSISGEAILGISDNFKPVVMPDNPIIDESYVEGFKVGDRVRFRDGYISPLEYEHGEGVITAADNLNFEVIWNGENDSDGYSKFYIANKQWWEKLDPLPSIDAVELPVIADAIATEPIESVAAPCMDEGSISVLVEADDRYQFLLEQREKLIESGASPQGVWINCGKVPHRDFRQAVWKSDKPQPQWGDKKSQYIGKFGGDEHLSAIAQHRAGQELRKVEREIKKLQVKS